MPGLDSEALDFRAASESFAAVRKLAPRATWRRCASSPTTRAARCRPWAGCSSSARTASATSRTPGSRPAASRAPTRAASSTAPRSASLPVRADRRGDRLRRRSTPSTGPRSAPCAARSAGTCRRRRCARRSINAVAHTDYAQRGAPIRAVALRRPPRGREPGPPALRPHGRGSAARRLEAAQPGDRPRLPRARPDRAVGQRHPAHDRRLPRRRARAAGVRGARARASGSRSPPRASGRPSLDDTDQAILDAPRPAARAHSTQRDRRRRSASRRAPRARGSPAWSAAGWCARSARGRRTRGGVLTGRHRMNVRRAAMPTLDWLNRAEALAAADRVPYRVLESVSEHGDGDPENLLITLARMRFVLARSLVAQIEDLRRVAMQSRYRQLVLDGGWNVEPDWERPFVFEPGRYAAHAGSRYQGRWEYKRHYYPVIADLKAHGEEFELRSRHRWTSRCPALGSQSRQRALRVLVTHVAGPVLSRLHRRATRWNHCGDRVQGCASARRPIRDREAPGRRTMGRAQRWKMPLRVRLPE